MPKPDKCCLGCTEREVGCHSWCERYKRYCAKNEVRKARTCMNTWLRIWISQLKPNVMRQDGLNLAVDVNDVSVPASHVRLNVQTTKKCLKSLRKVGFAKRKQPIRVNFERR